MPTRFFGRSLRRAVRLLSLCLIATLGAALATSAQAAGEVFRTTGSLQAPRNFHTATLLPNGKVLVAGGDGPNNGTSAFMKSAELYDPATGVWTSTGSMLTGRTSHTATLLPNGKVLVVGGGTTSCELYNPATGLWSFDSNLPGPVLTYHTATLLPSGKVLVSGGRSGTTPSNYATQAGAYLYDPATSQWTATGSLQTARYHHAATLLPNGKVLVAGGSQTLTSETATAEVYDPETGVWTPTGGLAEARYGTASALLANGKVIVAGGFTSQYVLNTAELYDPVSERWVYTGSPGSVAGDYTIFSAPLADGRFLVIQDTKGQVYDPATGGWPTSALLNFRRSNHTATLLPSGEVLVAGGDLSGELKPVAELYGPPKPPPWVATGALVSPRQHHTATLLPNGQVLAAGGNDSSSGTRVELYDRTTGTWTGTSNFSLLRDSHTATLLSGGRVLVAGGRTGSTPIKTAEIYDQATGHWTATGAMATARTSHTATLLGSGLVLVTGGSGPAALRSCELFDPATGMWGATGDLSTARDGHTAILLAGGKVLVVGGRDAAGAPVAGAELYDPATGQWSGTGGLQTARSGHTASLLAGGQVLVTGGLGPAPLASAELYDPVSGAWTPTGALAAARSGHTATVLPSGWVAVVGGTDGSGALASTELYNPSAGTWKAWATLLGARGSHTATLLTNGRLLIAGGFGPVAGGSNSLLNTAELFDFSGPLDPVPPPQVTSAALQLQNGTALAISGLNLSGSTIVVQLRNLANGQILNAPASSAMPPTATSFTSVPISGLVPGYFLATVIVDGVAGNSVVIQNSIFTPALFTAPPVSVSPVGATLRAQVAAYGAPVTASFAYSTDPALLQNVSTTAPQTVPAGTYHTVSQPVIHLTSATTYYVRVMGSASGFDLSGAILSFRTADPIPTQPTPPDATIAPTGGLAVAPSSSVLLPDGRVLLVGAPNVQIYDPASGLSRQAGTTLHRYASGFTTALMPNGRVLLVGGDTSNQFGTGAGSEIYDPVSGTWSQGFGWLGYVPTLTVLTDGRVLLAGGYWQSGAPLNVSYRYNPATGALAAGGAMNVRRNSHTATLLAGGKVLVAGGCFGNGTTPYKSAELFDPVTGAWTATGNLLNTRYDHTAVLLPNGKVLVLGGSQPTTAEVYDPATGAWAATGSPKVARTHPTATILPNGMVWVAGGSSTSSATELYDPATGVFTLAENLAAPRDVCTAALLPNGDVYLAGGTTAEIYGAARGAATAALSPGTARSAHTATVLPSGKLLLAGGTNQAAGASNGLVATELYDPADGSWTPGGDLHGARFQHTATLLTTGQVLAAGGVNGNALATSELYDPASGLWTPSGNLYGPRSGHTATLLPGGKVLVVGGGDGGGLYLFGESYDPATGTWSPTGNVVTPRQFHTASLLPNGQVLIAGGVDIGGHAVWSSEIYNPATNTWRAVGDMVAARANHGAALLPDGRVLAAGGRNDAGLLAAAEVYDPATEMWMPTRDLYEPRAYHTASVLVSGKILMADGTVAAQSPDPGLHASGEVYDPTTGTWTTAGPLVQGRQGHTASLLVTGRVLLTGGGSGAGAGTAELYDAGLGFDPARQAQLLGTSVPFGGGRALTLSGNRLLGPPGAGSSTARDSFSYYPVVQLRNLATDQVQPLSPAPSPLTMPTSWTSLPASGVPVGYYEVTVFTNGIPSNSLVVQVESSEPRVTTNAATALAAQGATLNAQVTASGLSTTVSFAYSLDPAVTQNVVNTAPQTVAANANGAPVSQAVTGLAPHRTYYFKAVATNSAGTTSGAIVSFTTDNTAPVAPNGVAAATTGDAKTITLPYAATDADGDPNTLLSASGPNLTVGNLSGNQVTITPDAGFAGTATLTYQIGDGTGLANGTATGSITVAVTDNDAPDTTITSAPSGTIHSNAATIVFGGVDNIGVASFQGRLDGAAFATVTSPVNLAGLIDGAHTYDVRALDAAGNPDGTPARASWTVDNTAPPVDTTPPVLTLPVSFIVDATSPAGAVVTYTASASDAGSGVASSSFTPPSGSQFPFGTTIVQATATDVAGNTSTGSFSITVRDDSGPVIVLNGANPLHVPLHGTYQEPGATATDAVDGNVAVRIFGTVDTDTPGNYTVNYNATDSAAHGTGASRTVIVGNGATLAVDDSYFSGSAQRTPLALHVLDNDLAVHPELLSIASVTRPIYGTAVIAPGGRSITYTPGVSYANFAGKETFSYTLHDEFGATATAKVTISNGAYREKGLYDGLLMSNGQVIGYVQVNLMPTGTFTGTLKIGIASSIIRGRLDVDQHAAVTLPGASLDLEFDGEAHLSATYVKATLTGRGVLSHATYNVSNNPAPQAGSYTVLLRAGPLQLGVAATATVQVDEATHQVAALQLTSGGLGYLLPPTVTILSPLGSGATGTATVTNGAVTGLTLTNPGARYPKTGVAVLIDHPSEGLTAASGYATMKVSQSGTVTWSGKVGDGTMLSGSGWLKEDHSLALYSVVPYRPGPAGTLSGTVMFDEVPDVSDLRGDLAWSKPPQRGAALYRAGFETTTPLLGSHYLRPAAREQALVFTNAPAGVATFTADDGDLVSAVNDTLSVSNTNIVRKTSTGADRLMLRIVPSTGLFSGTFLGVYPAGTVATKNVSAAFSGVLFQKQNLGEGLVVGPRHTGPVSLAPQ